MDNIMEGIVNESTEWIVGIFGDPKVCPRVGNQYQAEIPHLMMEQDYLQLITKPADTEVIIDSRNCLNMVGSIPIMWAHIEVRNIKDKALEVFDNRDTAVHNIGFLDAENSEESQITSNNEDGELQGGSQGTSLDDRETEGGSLDFQFIVPCDRMDVDLVLPLEKKIETGHGKNCCHPVPGVSSKDWSGIEYDSFVLGLYIFGKNLLLVKRFVESKEMGDVLSCYYGKFYRSSEYYKWSAGRKTRSRRCIHGQRIFTGWRKQELLSRLYSQMSEECQHMLMEVSKTIGEGQPAFEEYVFNVKDMVGINLLVEAVAIGKGRQDLTGNALEPTKTNHPHPVRPELPTGKACSSLTSAEIIEILTGDFRLSKARSSDLFWEAVWPRLLARGWHSEQPKDYGCAGSKNSLVFIVPGIKKFSKSRLEKGKHYYDSVSDVLDIVASDPELLELEDETAKISAHREEHIVNLDMKQDSEVLPNQHQRCYLQPHNSNCDQESIKFTIVDTSLFYREKRAKVRELRSLPADTMNESTPSVLSSESEQDTSEEMHDKVDDNITSNPVEVNAENRASADSREGITSGYTSVPSVPDPMIIAVETHKDQSTGISDDRNSRMKTKFQFSRKVKSRQSSSLVPIPKQHHLIVCSHEESSHGVNNISGDTKQNGEEFCDQSNSPDTCDNMALEVGTSQNLSSPSSLAESPKDRSKGIQVGDCNDAEPHNEQPCSQNLIDLYVPHITLESTIDEPSVTNMAHIEADSSANKLPSTSETGQQHDSHNPSNVGASTQQQPAMNGRRQSTRNRPLTTRVLEALELGFFDTKTKRKGTEATCQRNTTSKSSRRMRRKTGVSENSNDGVGDETAHCKINVNDGVGHDTACYKVHEGVNGGFTGETDMVVESRK